MTKIKSCVTSVAFLVILLCGSVSAFTITTFDIVKLNSVRWQTSNTQQYVSVVGPSTLSANRIQTLTDGTGHVGLVIGTPVSGHIATYNATVGQLVDGGAVGATCPGTASTTEVLYDNAGVCDGIVGFTSDGTNVTAGAGNLRATSPRITTSIFDANGLQIIGLVATASALNSVNITNAATGNPAIIASIGETNAALKLDSAGTGIISTGHAFVNPNTSLSDNGTTIATNAALANNFRITALTANVTLSNPTNPVDGQVITWEVLQNASAAKTLAFGAAFGFGAEITGCTISATLSSHNFVTAIYNSTTAKWYVRGCLTGY